MALTADQAQRKIDAIDKRIDAVRFELVRRVGAFDEMSAEGWQRAWDSYPGLQGVERSLFVRRGSTQLVRDAAMEREYRAEQRREQRAFLKSEAARRRTCPTCDSICYVEAA